jgi:hypothetical protein
MHQPSPGTAWIAANVELGRPGIVGRRATERAGRARAPVVKIPVTCEPAEPAALIPVSGGGRLTGLQAAARAARPDAPTGLEGARQDEWIGGCAGAEAIAAGFSLPGRAR